MFASSRRKMCMPSISNKFYEKNSNKIMLFSIHLEIIIRITLKAPKIPDDKIYTCKSSKDVSSKLYQIEI